MPGHPEIFVVGDTASLDQDGKPLPGVAQVAIQQGRYAGKLIHRRVTGKSKPGPFRYFDKGNMAVVGKGFAVLQSGKVRPQRLPRMARMGRGASSISGAIQPARECVFAMGLDLSYGAARLPAHSESPWRRISDASC